MVCEAVGDVVLVERYGCDVAGDVTLVRKGCEDAGDVALWDGGGSVTWLVTLEVLVALEVVRECVQGTEGGRMGMA